MFEADLDNAFENKYASKEEIPEEGAVALAGKQTQETLTATDLVIERLDIAEAEKKRIAEHQVYICSLVDDLNLTDAFSEKLNLKTCLHS